MGSVRWWGRNVKRWSNFKESEDSRNNFCEKRRYFQLWLLSNYNSNPHWLKCGVEVPAETKLCLNDKLIWNKEMEQKGDVKGANLKNECAKDVERSVDLKIETNLPHIILYSLYKCRRGCPFCIIFNHLKTIKRDPKEFEDEKISLIFIISPHSHFSFELIKKKKR